MAWLIAPTLLAVDDAGISHDLVPALAVIGAAFLAALATIAVAVIQTKRTVQHETRPNSGSTLRDAIDRVEATQYRILDWCIRMQTDIEDVKTVNVRQDSTIDRAMALLEHRSDT